MPVERSSLQILLRELYAAYHTANKRRWAKSYQALVKYTAVHKKRLLLDHMSDATSILLDRGQEHVISIARKPLLIHGVMLEEWLRND